MERTNLKFILLAFFLFAVGNGSAFCAPDGEAGSHTHVMDPTTGLCSICGQLESDGEGFVLISSGRGLMKFAQMVNDGETGLNARLTADLDLSGEIWEPIGNDGCMYHGVFDGQKHKICHLVYENDEVRDNAHPIGMFGTLTDGAELRNFYLDETCSFTGSSKYMGGIAGHSTSGGEVNLIGVGFAGNVYNSNTIAEGGTAGILGNANYNSVAHFNLCWVAGNITGQCDVAAINAWFGRTTPSGSMSDCWAIAHLNIYENGNKYLGRYGNLDVSNCYTNVGAQGTVIPSLTDECDSIGELCFKMNVNHQKPIWFQKIGVDKYPLPWGNDTVYANGVLNCDGEPIEGEITYTNTKTNSLPPHVFERGYCRNCSALDTSYKLTDDGVYALEDAWDVCWFSALVSNGHQFANAVLTSDIDMQGVEDYETIGNVTNPFKGSFDGQGHRICNLVINNEKEKQAFFGTVGGNAVVKNLVIDSSCSITCAKIGAGVVGALCGSGTVRIENCGNEASVTTSGKNCGGILGGSFNDATYGRASMVYISNCYNSGNISAIAESAAISGWLGDNCQVSNCFNIGQVTGLDGGKTFARIGSNNARFFNCYETLASQVNHVSVSDVQSGALCYMLNDGAGETIWYQTLADDAHPVFDNTHKTVFQTAVSGANGYYANVSENVTIPSMVLTDKADYRATTAFIAANLSYERQLEEGFNSLCVPFALTTAMLPEGCKLFEVDEVGTTSVKLKDVNEVAAGKPCVVKVPATCKPFTTLKNVAMVAGADNSGVLKGAFSNTVIGADKYKLAVITSGETVFGKTSTVATITAFRSYLDTDAGVKTLNIIWDDGTGIELVHGSTSDGQENIMYDLSGRRVSQPTKGLYIVNGRKVKF